jgi:hypothetical protein
MEYATALQPRRMAAAGDPSAPRRAQNGFAWAAVGLWVVPETGEHWPLVPPSLPPSRWQQWEERARARAQRADPEVPPARVAASGPQPAGEAAAAAAAARPDRGPDHAAAHMETPTGVEAPGPSATRAPTEVPATGGPTSHGGHAAPRGANPGWPAYLAPPGPDGQYVQPPPPIDWAAWRATRQPPMVLPGPRHLAGSMHMQNCCGHPCMPCSLAPCGGIWKHFGTQPALKTSGENT